ncbi:XRE family transcriptional regulator [Pacificibacter maritimus]|uniref:XRE family transcriptional regulator n=1 Tax=Pacificibacter maritimus TaxID=762213 RepID=A0A3N4UDT9_9RHOB|nr:cupin domain-containing protein [Pacificibacter maritimus]RPE66605.1 XRE family transcriptional regulator [Pacificibacter maritimus]
MTDFDVGARLKAIRKARKISQRELATQSGVTNGLISLIEGNKSSPSISSLKKILSVFSMSLSDFFDASPTDNRKFAFRFDEMVEINPERVFEGGTEEGLKAVSLRRVGSSFERTLLMLYEIYEPGADTGPELYAHEGEEGGFVIEGEILLQVGESTETLKAGDAYQFESTLPHRFRNIGDKRCVLVSACTPPTF